MEMRTVYRYENAKGEGPYRCHTWPDMEALWAMCDSHSGVDHPTWMPDFIGMNPKYYVAGCDSRESLDAWFDGFHESLAKNGFTVREYTVPANDVVDSQSGLQVAFRR